MKGFFNMSTMNWIPKLAHGRAAGVRPSSGAAGSGSPGMRERSETRLLARVAAPEDGRTPTQPPSAVITARSVLGGLIGFLAHKQDAEKKLDVKRETDQAPPPALTQPVVHRVWFQTRWTARS